MSSRWLPTWARLPEAHAWWWPLLFFLLALGPRLAAIGRYVTPDELQWVYRSLLMREALLGGDWARTITTGHPGVLTTWLGAAGMSLQLWLQPASGEAYDWLTRIAYLTPDNAAAYRRLAVFLTAGRLAVILLNSLGIAAAYRLALPLVGPLAAGLAAWFLALDPFLAGLAGLLHVDGLLATFSFLALLALARSAWHPAGAGWRQAGGAGALAALALLAKSPALLLLPAAAVAWSGRIALGIEPAWPDRVRVVLRGSLQWLFGFLVTAVALLPALWVAPARVWDLLSGSAARHVETALRPTFFLGSAAYDHGWLFYPIALVWRLSPLLLLGLAIGLAWGARTWLRRRLNLHQITPLLLLLGWSVFFLLAIGTAAKKFDRYALPVVPALTLLAAYGWTVLLAWLRRRSVNRARLVSGLVGAGQLLLLLWALPYPLRYYNPLVGGGTTATQVLTVGWGEGVSAAGRWLAVEPALAGAVVVADNLPSLVGFYSGPVQHDNPTDAAAADVVVLSDTYRQLDPDGYTARTESLTPLHVIQLAGLPAAWIYRQEPVRSPPPVRLAQPVGFGGALRLTATDLAAAAEAVTVRLGWTLAMPTDERYTLQLRVTDAQGQTWLTRNYDLLDEQYFYPADWQAESQPTGIYTLTLAPGTPPGLYHVTLAVFQAGGQLPARNAAGSFLGVQFPIGWVHVPLPSAVVNATRLTPSEPATAAWANGTLRLWGHSTLTSSLETGARFTLELAWQGTDQLPPGLGVRFTLGAAEIARVALSPFDPGDWRTGEVVLARYTLAVPADQPPGSAMLTAQPITADGEALGEPYPLGLVTINATDRLFQLPVDMPVPLAYQFGPAITLRGLAPPAEPVTAGSTLPLILYWQALTTPEQAYTVFVHVLDNQGEIVAQLDRPPGSRPTHTWAAEEVIVDAMLIPLPADLPAGSYRLAVGLYTPADGQRLPIEPPGVETGDDRLILPSTVAVGAE